MTPEHASRRRLWRLHTKTSVEQGTTVLFLEGRLGHAAAAELATIAGQRLPAIPPHHAESAWRGPRLDASGVIIDLSGVDYLSSAALKVFQSLADAQSRAGGRLTLRAPSVAARLALELSGLLALVDSHPEEVGAADEPPQN